MARNRTGNYPISGKACDVEYRAKRLEVLTEKARLALSSIDPNAVAEGAVARGLELITELAEITKQIAGTKPAKRTYGKGAEKKAKVAAVEEKPKRSRKVKARAEETQSVEEELGSLNITGLDEALDAAAE
jgi:hypothetical protein